MIMAFAGYLFSSGGEKFNDRYIYKESYKVSRKYMDLDSFRNANGVLERNVLDHTSATITFETKPMNNSDMAAMMAFFSKHYSVPRERKISLIYYSVENDSYLSGYFYMADPEYPIHHIWDNVIWYSQMQIKLVEY